MSVAFSDIEDVVALIERGDAILRRYEFRTSLIGDGAHEVEDGLFRRPLIPRSERCSLRRLRPGE